MVYCDSYDCPYSYTLIDQAAQQECNNGQCETSTCCDKVCSSFDCPIKLSPVKDADTTVCKDNKCTRDQCCEKGDI